VETRGEPFLPDESGACVTHPMYARGHIHEARPKTPLALSLDFATSIENPEMPMRDDSTGGARTFIAMRGNNGMVRVLKIRLEDYSPAGAAVHHSN